MLNIKKALLFFALAFLAIVLVACTPGDFGATDDEIITSIYVSGNSFYVEYLDGSKKDLGKPEKDALGEPGIVSVSFDSAGRMFVHFSNDEELEVGYLVGSNEKLVEYEIKNNFIRWRYLGSNDSYQNLISLSLISSADLRDDIDVVYAIHHNEFSWRDINDNEWSSLLGYFSLASLFGLSNIEVLGVIIDENNNAIVSLSNGMDLTFNLPFINHTVTFKDDLGNVISEERVGHNFPFSYPDVEALLGHEVIWDKEISNVVEDLVITYQNVPREFNLIFDGENILPKPVSFGSEFGSLPLGFKEGHRFIGWKTLDGLEVNELTIFNFTEDVTLVPIFRENPTTSYIINYYKMNSLGNYILMNSNEVFEYAGEEVNVVDPIEPGYHVNRDLSVMSGLVLENEVVVFSIYMDISIYKISFDISSIGILENNDPDPDLEEVDFELDDINITFSGIISNLPSVYKEGHIFLGWEDSSGNLVLEGTLYNKIENTVLVPRFTVAKEYIVQYYQWTHITNVYQQIRVDYKYATIGKVVNAEVSLPYGFVLDNAMSVLSDTISEGRNTVLKVYYKYKTFSVTYVNRNGVTIRTDDLPYLSLIANISAPMIDGYTFANWITNEGAIVPFGSRLTENMTLKATYTNNTVGYRVTHVKLDYDNTEISRVTETFTTKSFTNFSAELKEYHGFLYNSGALTGRTEANHYDVNLTIYYKSYKYYVTFKVGNQTFFEPSGYYGEAVPFPDNPPKPGYLFDGWYDGDMVITEMTFGDRFNIIQPRSLLLQTKLSGR